MSAKCMKSYEVKERAVTLKNYIELQPKVEAAKEIIRKALEQSKNPIVAFSGGKDSLVMLHLVRSVNPDVKSLFGNTSNEYPETLQFIKTIPNLDIVRPEMSFKEVVDKYGLPTMKAKTNKEKESRNVNCCIILKERPAIKYYRENNIDLVFLGITTSESRNRRLLVKVKGNYYYQKTKKVWHCLPIADWTVDDIWCYIDFHGLEYNKIYDKVGRSRRCGCRMCTAYLSWKENMAAYDPKDIKRVQAMVGQLTW